MTNKPMLSVDQKWERMLKHYEDRKLRNAQIDAVQISLEQMIEKIQYFLTFLMLVILLVGVYAVGTSGIGVSIEVCEEVKTQVVCEDRS